MNNIHSHQGTNLPELNNIYYIYMTNGYTYFCRKGGHHGTEPADMIKIYNELIAEHKNNDTILEEIQIAYLAIMADGDIIRGKCGETLRPSQQRGESPEPDTRERRPIARRPIARSQSPSLGPRHTRSEANCRCAERNNGCPHTKGWYWNSESEGRKQCGSAGWNKTGWSEGGTICEFCTNWPSQSGGRRKSKRSRSSKRRNTKRRKTKRRKSKKKTRRR